MKNAIVLRRFCIVVLASFTLLACGGKSSGGNPPDRDEGRAPEQQPVDPKPVAGDKLIDTTLMLTLALGGGNAVTDEQAQSVLTSRCASCHNTETPARLDLTILPTASQGKEVKRRIELPVTAQGHMPIGSALTSAEATTLVSWLDIQAAAAASDPYAAYKVEARDAVLGTAAPALGIKSLGNGRYAIGAGHRRSNQTLSVNVIITGPDGVPRTVRIDVASIPDSGVIYKSIDLKKISGTLPPPHVDPTDPTDPITPDTTVDAHLELRLLTADLTAITDEAALSVLRAKCQTCHNADNRPRIDLTIVPASGALSDIARRINLDRNAIGHMPLTGTLSDDDLRTLNQWLGEQQTGSDQFNGYFVSASDTGSDTALTTSPLLQGRTRIDLGRQRPGTTVIVAVTVTGADGLSEVKTVPVTVPAGGVAPAEIVVASRDKTAPTVADERLNVSALTSTSVTLGFAPAGDDRPTDGLVYVVYRLRPDGTSSSFETVDEVEAHGLRIGDDLTASRGLSLDVTGLEPYTAYDFNVIVRDQTGNKAVYQKVQVLTLPQVLCSELAQAGSIQTWRNNIAAQLGSGSLSGDDAAVQIRQCFPARVPQCVQRTLNFAERDDLAPSGSDGTLADVPQKRPPDEIRDIVPGKYWIPDNIEQIAAEKGWTSVRYKSRHAGGFDGDTPNLLMVYVPGDKVDPPVAFDRWLNFPLPKDDDEPAMGLPQHPRPKFGPPSRAAYAEPNDFPGTFTMMSLDRAGPGVEPQVYFQMFRRGNDASFTPGGAVDVGGCVSCHPNGLRAISPLGYHVRAGEERLPDQDWKAVEYINRMMEESVGYKAAGWGRGVSQGVSKPLYRAERGPIMGPARPVNGISRTREFIMGGTLNGQQLAGCYNRRTVIEIRDIFFRAPGSYVPNYRFSLSATPSIDPEKVIAAMSCEGCHVNGQRWPLNDDTSISQVQFKILGDQSMPLGMHMNPLDPGNDTGEVVDLLTPDERFALVNCLEAEFQLEKSKPREWMTQESCQE